MEKLYSHSKPPTFSSKTKPPPPQPPYNNAGFFSATSYDDVFGGPPKFASSSSLAHRPEDYSEIFGGFRLTSSSSSSTRASSSSSIPVLDLPAVPDDIGAAFFDYSEVFGGFNAVDFAVPFDQLFHPCDGAFVDDEDEDDVHGDIGGGGGGGASSDEAWTPVGTDSLSDESDQFASSEKSQRFSSMNPHQQSESKLFNVSYHKVNPGTNAYMPSTVHVAQFNDMPGFTCVVDEATLLREIGKEKCSTVDDTQKITKKTRSHASDGNFGRKAHNSDLNPTFAPISEVDLETEPSHFPPSSESPPVVADMSGEFNVPHTDLNASEKCGSKETVDCALPPFFDMEVDANSFAAASAAAVEDAMEKAQAKMKTAKESRVRKDKTQNCGKLHLHNEANGGESIQRPRHESLSGETRVHATDRGPNKIKVESVQRPLDESLTGETRFSETDRRPSNIKVNAKAWHTKDTSQNLLNILSIDQLNGVPEKPAETKQGKRKSLSKDNALTNVGGQWKEATQYYEFVNSENTQSAPQTHSTDGDAKIKIMHQNDDDDYDSGGEAYVAGENRRRLKVTKAVSRQEYYEKMVKVALEVHDGVKCGNLGPDKKLKHIPQRNPRQQKPELVYEPEMLEIPLYRNQEMQESPGEGFSNESDNEEEGSQACHRNQVDKNVEGLESMVEVASFVGQRNSRGSCKKDEGDYSVQDTVGRGHEQRAHVSHQMTKSKVEESSKQKRDKEAREAANERSTEASEGVLIGDTMQAAYGSEERDDTSELQKTKDADRRLKEACENMSGKDTMITGKSQENNVTRNLQQRDGHGNHVWKEGDGQGSKRTLQKCVKQDKCEIEQNVSEQAIGRQRLCETHDLIDETKNPEEGEKPDADEVKPENATELEHVKLNSLQACEMDELWCKLEETVDCPGPAVTLKRSVELEKGAVNTEVLEQAMRMEKLDDACDSIADTKNSEESQEQDEKKMKLEKTAAQEHELLKKCDLRETTNINENTGNENHKGLYGSSTTFVWEYEDQGPTSSPYMEPSVENKNLKPSNGAGLFGNVDQNNFCKLRKPEKNGDGFKAVSEDSELKARTSQASDMIGLNGNNDVGANDRTEQTRKKEKKEISQSTSDLNLEKDVSIQGTKRNQVDSQFIFDQEESVRSTPTEHASREEITQTVLPEKEQSQKTSLIPNVGQSFERKGKIMNYNCLPEDKDGEKERALENERLQKLQEEEDRLREREKDRMAVEMTIREARDRAYADARDRAERAALERATDDARQRAMTEARERLEKACAEARERSLADREARLRAERAAVERATAEARQRAIEKAMAERTTFEARDRMQRSVSEKYISEREVIMRQSSFPASNERFETSNSEPAQRCKARLERHRRTVERVAKALAEKNMRDLVAQREQAERTRFAETLDADIRRWSSGKEGNLRALLSTLQYILGPDSGWHPIPLTEVITAAAVKKAYRKATLCVHPDKLQQRGASIQQKYICEKVFDLLKEAWNKFNSEEK